MSGASQGIDGSAAVQMVIDPSHVRSLLSGELAEPVPGGVVNLAYANLFNLRFPLEAALTDQSEEHQVLAILGAEMAGNGPPTGFEPAQEENKLWFPS
jgi:hypothetical protein